MEADLGGRYSRHIRIPGFELEHQERLAEGSVLVIGLGGLGSPASLYLASAGVGRIGIADFDRVEEHNLQRQIIYSEKDVGISKLEAASRQLTRLNSGIEVVSHEEGIKQGNIRDVFSDYDVIVDGSDNFGTRYLVNDASYLTGKPLVFGSVFQYEGQVSVFNVDKDSPCYRCFFPEPPSPGMVPNCNEAGVIGALCGIIGSMQAMEAIKLLTKLGESACGKLIRYDSRLSRVHSIAVPKDENCPLCGGNPLIRDLETQSYSVPCDLPEVNLENEMNMEITVEEAVSKLESGSAKLLDVREPDELEICKIDGALHIPMGSITERLSELPDDEVIVFCHHGMRSLRVTEYLVGSGRTNVVSMKGGIDAWSQKFDSSVPRY